MGKKVIDIRGRIKTVGESAVSLTEKGDIGETTTFKYVIFETDEGKEVQVNNLVASVEFSRFVKPAQPGHFVIFRSGSNNSFVAIENDDLKQVEPTFYSSKDMRNFHIAMFVIHFICAMLVLVLVGLVLLPLSIAAHVYLTYEMKRGRRELEERGFSRDNLIESY